jgi:hypothetical protein
MIELLIKPNPETLYAACKVFDEENALIESTLGQLFASAPSNVSLENVFLKVIALNTLYSTQIHLYSDTIPTIEDVARHIHSNADAIDTALRNGSANAVELISEVSVPGKEKRNYFSFATKYCNWSNPEAYPIYDSRVMIYLLSLFHHDNFAEAHVLRGNGCDYKTFRELIDIFREHYGFHEFSYKIIDKFLYQSGSAALLQSEKALASAPSADIGRV